MAIGPLGLLGFGLLVQHQVVPLHIFFLLIGALNLASGLLFFLPMTDDLDQLSQWQPQARNGQGARGRTVLSKIGKNDMTCRDGKFPAPAPNPLGKNFHP